MNSLEKKRAETGLEELAGKIKYTVKEKYGFISVTAHLPPGFTMPSFERMFRMKNKPPSMTEQEFVIQQQNEMFQDLINRIKDKDRRLLK